MVSQSHWATIEPHLKQANLMSWLAGEDQKRIAAYDAYEAIYWTAPESFQLTLRGQEGKPIYIPSGRKIVETAHRYLAAGLGVMTNPAFGSDQERADADLLFADFAAREKFFAKFSANKRQGLIKGDWLWHLYADPNRPPGSRISIWPLDPSLYFPEFLNDDPSLRVAVHLVEPTMHGNDAAVRVLTYRKESNIGGPSTILMDEAIYKQDEWGQPGTDMALGRPLEIVTPQEALPAPIDALPVYHVPNGFDTMEPWGHSEMAGVETLMKAINQGATDEEITLTLEGLGVYVTDAGAPLDDEGHELPWTVAPARVIEVPEGKNFTRVSGVGTVTPYQDHLRFLSGAIDEATNTNDVTRGTADVSVAESGIALALRMNPLLSHIAEEELVVTDVDTQMLYDLRRWFDAYEGLNLENIRWQTTYGDKLPINKNQLFANIITMVTSVPPLISTAEARRQLSAIGYTFSDDRTLNNEIGADAQRTADATGLRTAADLMNANGAPVG